MIRFVDKGNCIFDREENLSFMKNETNERYQDYLVWVNEGNTPISEKPGPEYVLVDDAWEVDADLLAGQQAGEARDYLAETDPMITRYQEDLAAGRRLSMPESKYKNLLKKRARAQKTIANA